MAKFANRNIIHIGFLILLSSLASVSPGQPLEQYLHKNARLDSSANPESSRFRHKPISSRQAASFAVEYLRGKGASNIVVCEVLWIAAPLGGYLVDAKAKAVINGSVYSIFRIGVRDGSEQHDGTALPGEVFAFLARGRNRSGKPHWYPPPGPDVSWHKGVTEGMLAYEFLLNREKFVTLDKRYR